MDTLQLRRRRTTCTWRLLALGGLVALSTCGGEPAGPGGAPAPIPTSIILTPRIVSLTSLNETVSITASVRDQNGAAITGAGVAWSASDSAIVSVSSQGVVTALAEGEATVQATSGTVVAIATVTIEQVPMSISLSDTMPVLSSLGDTTSLIATVLDAGGSEVSGSRATWTSSDVFVARVTSAGLLSAIGNGSAVITASVLTLSADATVTVEQTPDSIALSVDSLVMLTGEVDSVEVAVFDPGRSEIPGPTVVWGSSDEGVVSVSTAGVLTALSNGSATVTVEVSSADSTAVSEQIAVQVYDPVEMTTLTLPTGITGVSYNEAFAASGGDGAFTWARDSGALPDGLTLSTDGVISGTPTIQGASDFEVRVTTGDGQTIATPFELTVFDPLTVTTTSLPATLVGQPYSSEIAVSGGGQGLTGSVSVGALPDGLTLDGSTLIVSGAANSAGSFAFTFQVVSGDGQVTTRPYTIDVTEGLTVTTAALAPGLIGGAYLDSLGAGGGSGNYSWALTGGALPVGLTLSVDGVITGIPSAVESTAFTVTVSDTGDQASWQLGIEVADTLKISTTSLPPAVVEDPFIQALSTTGGIAPSTWSIASGSLPPGVNLGAATGLIDGVPTELGSSTFTVEVTSSDSQTALRQLTMVVEECEVQSPADTDGDRLPDCRESNTSTFVSARDTGTDPSDPDTDGDGISDGDEVLGSVAGLDLPSLGVSPLRKDILVEYDWFDDSQECPSHSHQPTAAIAARVTNSFAAAPVLNPDGSTGINYIHDYGQGGVFTGGNLISDVDGVLDGGVNGTEFLGYKAVNFSAERRGYFRYVMLPHRYNSTSTSSGQAEVGGDDMIVSLWCSSQVTGPVSNTIAHELGHNLGLRHGGFEGTNYKPNYNSVMNYKYQFPGVDINCTPPGDGSLNYSTGERPDLDEANLDESQGVCGNPPGPAWDWNDDGDTTDNGFERDINTNNGGVGDNTIEVLEDYDDWSNLFFGGMSVSDGAPLVQEIVSCVAEAPPGPGQ